MVVSAIDLIYVFGRSFLLSDDLTLLVQFGWNQYGDLVSTAIDPGWWVTAALNNILVFILV